MSQEQDLKLLGVSYDLCEGRDCCVIGSFPQLVVAIVNWSCMEGFSVNRVPIDEQVLNRAVIMGKDRRQLRDLTMGQAVVLKPKKLVKRNGSYLLESLDGALYIKSELHDLE